MKRAVLALVPLLLTFQFLAAQSSSSDEEAVRNAYAKASLLCALEPLTETGIDQVSGLKTDEAKLTKDMKAAAPQFTLSNFSGGSIVNISSEPWGKYATMPQTGSQILGGAVHTYNLADAGNGTSWNVLRASWQTFNGDSDFIKTALARSVADTIRIGSAEWSNNSVAYTHYVTFTATVTFQGKTVGPYQAIFFIGKSGAQEVITSNDVISGQLVSDALSSDFYPSGLVSSSLRKQPAIAQWLKDNTIPTSSCSAAAAGHHLCCSQGRCGLSEAEVTSAMATPLPAPKDGGRQ